MSLIHELLIHAKSDEKIRTLVSLLQALCRSDAGGDVITASTSGAGSPGATRTSGFASHAIRHRSRFGGYIKGLETKVQGCVEQGDEDETREGGLAVLSFLVIDLTAVSRNIRIEESQRNGPFRTRSNSTGSRKSET